jgi:hypothetical protein
VSQEVIRSVGFEAGSLNAMLKRYSPDNLRDGPNRLPDGEEIFYISNPALGLWALKSQFQVTALTPPAGSLSPQAKSLSRRALQAPQNRRRERALASTARSGG